MKISLTVISVVFSFTAQASHQAYLPKLSEQLHIHDRIELLYDVDNAGHATNVRIVKALYPGIFGHDIERQIKKWRFEPNHPAKDIHQTIILEPGK